MLDGSLVENLQASRFFRFCLVGLVSNACLLLLFALLVRLGAVPVAASVLVYAIGVAGTYAAQRSWSFRSSVAHLTAGPRFVAAHAIGACTQAILVHLGTARLHVNPTIMQMLAMIVVALLVYTLLLRFTFNDGRQLTSTDSTSGRLGAGDTSSVKSYAVYSRLLRQKLARYLATRDVLWVVGAFAASRILLIAIGLLALAVFGTGTPDISAASIVDLARRWDSNWYVSLIEEGYNAREKHNQPGATNYAFFPVYPALVWLTMKLTGLSPAPSGVLLSNAMFLLALFVVHKYVATLGFGRDVARSTVMLICIAPQSIVFSAIYAESAFLLFGTLAMLHMRRERPLASGLSAACLSGVRPNGGLFVVFAITHIWRRHGFEAFVYPWRKPEIFLPLALAPLGVVAYWWFCFISVGDAFAQPTTILHGWGWSSDWPWTNLATFLTRGGVEAVFWATTSLGLCVCSLALLKFRLYEEFALALASFLLFWSGSIPNSLLRYSMLVFPIYVGLARLAANRPFLLVLIVAVFATINCFTMIAWALNKVIAI
jgi:putative flippase GtrA